jgi:hypothetical protein
VQRVVGGVLGAEQEATAEWSAAACFVGPRALRRDTRDGVDADLAFAKVGVAGDQGQLAARDAAGPQPCNRAGVDLRHADEVDLSGRLGSAIGGSTVPISP